MTLGLLVSMEIAIPEAAAMPSMTGHDSRDLNRLLHRGRAGPSRFPAQHR